jgi:hypothetical protein
MPSFFQSVLRIVQGKPVYDANNEQSQSSGPFDNQIKDPLSDNSNEASQPVAAEASHEEHSSIQKNDSRTFPVAFIHRTITRFNGPNMQVYCYIRNAWNEPLDLHKIEAFEHESELKRPLRPGEEHEFVIYEGPLLESPNEHLALLVYKTETGDYFEAIHEVRFKFNSVVKRYYVDEIVLRLPIKDIYG